MKAANAAPPDARPGAGISVTGLSVHFGRVCALDGVDLQIEPGQIVALAGENGAGKTTLLRCVAGDVTPTAGYVLVGGRPAPANPLAVTRRGVGVLWQDLSLCDNMTIAANLLLGREGRWQLLSDLRLHSDAAGLLSSMGIPLPQTTRGVRSLSGGERQLVAIARATDTGPQLLLLDEPTASLGIRYAAQVEELIAAVRAQGTTVVIACHNIDMMLRVADRIVVLRHGKVTADVESRLVHPDDVVALLSGQELDSSARRQLTRLHGLTGRLVSADPASSLQLILSALGAALRCERLCIHLADEDQLVWAASLGLPDGLRRAWARLPRGAAGGPAGITAATGRAIIARNARSDPAWVPFTRQAAAAGITSSWSVPVLAPGGLAGVITAFPGTESAPNRDQLELVTVYAGYAASAIERDRLLDEVTARNLVLETIREVLETLAGQVPVAVGLELALQSLRRGLKADQVALVTRSPDGALHCRAIADQGGGNGAARGRQASAERLAALALADPRPPGVARRPAGDDAWWHLAVSFAAPVAPAVLLASWQHGAPTAEAGLLIEDAAHSLRLALEREAAAAAHQEATALRRSQELQRDFLSRLSHELRTPLTAIRGYASSLLQPDVVWDDSSQRRFLERVATESARLGRLVDDLLDFSAIELGILRLQPDWCDIGLVLEAARACLPPQQAEAVRLSRATALPAVWADHDRLEQVFVNLLANATGHNPPGTRVTVLAAADGPESVTVAVTDDGAGLPAEIAAAPFEPRRGRQSQTAGAGLGLSIARGIVAAHGGRMDLTQPGAGTCVTVRLPVEESAGQLSSDGTAELALPPGSAGAMQPLVKGHANDA